MKILIYMESGSGSLSSGSLELISLARGLGGGTALVVGPEAGAAAEQAAGYGVPVLAVNGALSCQDEVLAVIARAAREEAVDLVLFGATQQGKDLAPRLAARLDTGCITDVVDVKREGDELVFTRPAYGGAVLERMAFAPGRTAVVSVRGGSFPRPEAEEATPASRQALITLREADVPQDQVRARLVETAREITELVNLEGADVVVSGGRGCTNAETFGLVRELAGLLGGVVGASRPAIEEGWVSRAHQVGQSGKNVAPRLYIACGISGAMQHVSGITGSDYIVAVNKDADAPIFDVADVGIVGRCEEILPLMIEEIRRRRDQA